jgi:hypothetical protein
VPWLRLIVTLEKTEGAIKNEQFRDNIEHIRQDHDKQSKTIGTTHETIKK